MTRHAHPPVVALALALSLTALTSACLRPRATPALRYFTLSTTTTAPASFAAQVRIAAVVAEPSYSGTRMATRVSAHRIAYSTFDRWAAPPAVLVTGALERSFAGPAKPATAPRILLTGRLHRFEGVTYGDTPHAAVSLTLTAEHEGTLLLRETRDATAPLDGDGPEAVAAALSQALDRILAGFVAELATRLPAA